MAQVNSQLGGRGRCSCTAILCHCVCVCASVLLTLTLRWCRGGVDMKCTVGIPPLLYVLTVPARCSPVLESWHCKQSGVYLRLPLSRARRGHRGQIVKNAVSPGQHEPLTRAQSANRSERASERSLIRFRQVCWSFYILAGTPTCHRPSRELELELNCADWTHLFRAEERGTSVTVFPSY
jgi:hypothetical protein